MTDAPRYSEAFGDKPFCMLYDERKTEYEDMTPEDVLARPGVSIIAPVPAGGVEPFLADPYVGAYMDAGFVVFAVFEIEADAIELDRRLAEIREDKARPPGRAWLTPSTPTEGNA